MLETMQADGSVEVPFPTSFETPGELGCGGRHRLVVADESLAAGANHDLLVDNNDDAVAALPLMTAADAEEILKVFGKDFIDSVVGETAATKDGSSSSSSSSTDPTMLLTESEASSSTSNEASSSTSNEAAAAAKSVGFGGGGGGGSSDGDVSSYTPPSGDDLPCTDLENAFPSTTMTPVDGGIATASTAAPMAGSGTDRGEEPRRFNTAGGESSRSPVAPSSSLSSLSPRLNDNHRNRNRRHTGGSAVSASTTSSSSPFASYDVVLGENYAPTTGTRKWWQVRRRWKLKQERSSRKRYGTIKGDDDLLQLKAYLHENLKRAARDPLLPDPVFWIKKKKKDKKKQSGDDQPPAIQQQPPEATAATCCLHYKGRDYVEATDQQIKQDFRNNARTQKPFHFEGPLSRAITDAIEECHEWMAGDTERESVAAETIRLIQAIRDLPCHSSDHDRLQQKALVSAEREPHLSAQHRNRAEHHRLLAEQLRQHEKLLLTLVNGLANDMVERHRKLFGNNNHNNSSRDISSFKSLGGGGAGRGGGGLGGSGGGGHGHGNVGGASGGFERDNQRNPPPSGGGSLCGGGPAWGTGTGHGYSSLPSSNTGYSAAGGGTADWDSISSSSPFSSHGGVRTPFFNTMTRQFAFPQKQEPSALVPARDANPSSSQGTGTNSDPDVDLIRQVLQAANGMDRQKTNTQDGSETGRTSNEHRRVELRQQRVAAATMIQTRIRSFLERRKFRRESDTAVDRKRTHRYMHGALADAKDESSEERKESSGKVDDEKDSQPDDQIDCRKEDWLTIHHAQRSPENVRVLSSLGEDCQRQDLERLLPPTDDDDDAQPVRELDEVLQGHFFAVNRERDNIPSVADDDYIGGARRQQRSDSGLVPPMPSPKKDLAGADLSVNGQTGGASNELHCVDPRERQDVTVTRSQKLVCGVSLEQRCRRGMEDGERIHGTDSEKTKGVTTSTSLADGDGCPFPADRLSNRARKSSDDTQNTGTVNREGKEGVERNPSTKCICPVQQKSAGGDGDLDPEPDEQAPSAPGVDSDIAHADAKDQRKEKHSGSKSSSTLSADGDDFPFLANINREGKEALSRNPAMKHACPLQPKSVGGDGELDPEPDEQAPSGELAGQFSYANSAREPVGPETDLEPASVSYKDGSPESFTHSAHVSGRQAASSPTDKTTETFWEAENGFARTEKRALELSSTTGGDGRDRPKAMGAAYCHATRNISWRIRSEGKKDVEIRKGLPMLKNVYQQPLSFQDGFRPPVFNRTPSEQETIQAALSKNFAFSDLSPSDRKRLVLAFESCEFRTDETVIRQGDAGDYFFVVQSGQVMYSVDGVPVGRAGAGSSFGELALMYLCPRSATVVATRDSQLFRVDQATFRFILESQTKQREKDKMNLLRNVETLQDLTQADLKRLSLLMVPRVFRKGEFLVRKGDSGDALHVLKEGQVLVTDTTSVGSAVFQDQILSAGDYFGENDLVASKFRDTDVVALTPGIAFSIDRGTFEKALGGMSRLSFKSHDVQKLSGVEFLQKANLDTHRLSKLADLMTFNTYKVGETILDREKEGKQRAGLWFVREGRVHLKSDKRDEVIEAGGVFGEELMIRPDTPMAALYDAVAMANCLCGRLSLEDCQAVFDTDILKDDTGELVTTADYENFSKSHCVQKTKVALGNLKRHRILGEGTFGQVWLVSEELHKGASRPYALKVQSKHELAREGQIEAVAREKDIMTRTNHPFICGLIETYQDEKFVFLLLDFVQGGELFSLIHERGSAGLPEPQAKFYAMCVADALAYLHRRKIVYRDLKPSNLMIAETGYPSLIDFGFAKYVEEKTYTLCGTPAYLPPEVVMTRGHDCSADHWSFGVLIHEMVTGENPFYCEGMDQMCLLQRIVQEEYQPASDISGDAADIIAALLVKNPSHRLGSLARGERGILEHSWFAGLDIFTLRRKGMDAPWKPTLQDPLDSSCFEDWTEPDYT